MAVKGDRFRLDLDSEVDDLRENSPRPDLLLQDIKERDPPSSEGVPSPPDFKKSSSGFPTHRDRRKISKFRQRGGVIPSNGDLSLQNAPRHNSSQDLLNKGPQEDNKKEDTDINELQRSISQENNDRISHMSGEEIEAAKQELSSMLSPSLLDRFLKKATIDDTQSKIDLRDEIQQEAHNPGHKVPSRKVTFEDPTSKLASETPPTSADNTQLPPLGFDPDAPPSSPPADLQAASTFKSQPLPAGIHFPTPAAQPPDLDPTSTEFLTSLRETYFPQLSADPSSQSWMAPPDPSEREVYSATSESLPASSIRFDFRGRLLPPRLSAQIPVSKGLHHHGHAPESAGYTIPELAHLARSAVSAQRCVAYQTLGRILYRLGRGDFGGEEENLYEGLWDCVEKGRVIEGMVEAAGQENGHRSVWATATEAVWLWRKGGGRKRQGR